MIKAKKDLCEAQAREIARLNAEVKSLGVALQLAAREAGAEDSYASLITTWQLKITFCLSAFRKLALIQSISLSSLWR